MSQIERFASNISVFQKSSDLYALSNHVQLHLQITQRKTYIITYQKQSLSIRFRCAQFSGKVNLEVQK